MRVNCLIVRTLLYSLCLFVYLFIPISGQEKKALKEEKLKQEEKYMWAIVDGVKEKVCFNSIHVLSEFPLYNEY